MRRTTFLFILLTVSSSVVTGLPNVTHATSTTNLSMPTVSVCQSAGSRITVALTASSVTNLNAWQVTLTFSNLSVISQTVGSSWTAGGSSSYLAMNVTNSQSIFFGFLLLNSAHLTSTTPVTMLTITFKVLYSPDSSEFHIVLPNEGLLVTKLLNPDASNQTYTTADGSFTNCIDAPVRDSHPSSPAITPSNPCVPLTNQNYASCVKDTRPPGTVAYLQNLQVLPTNNYSSDIILPGGDKVSWGFEATGLVNHDGTNRSWNISNFGAGVKIAILDTGVNGTQLSDLQGQVVAYYNYFSGSYDQYAQSAMELQWPQ